MRLYSKITLDDDIQEEEIQDRDIAILELHSELQKYVELAALCDPGSKLEKIRQNETLKKYEDFVKATAALYGYSK